MGLDQYCYLGRKSKVLNPLCFEENFRICQFWQWRKNRFVQNFMEDVYKKNCQALEIEPTEFNLLPMALTLDDIKELKLQVVHKELRGDTGFFWGTQAYTDYMQEDDLDFCNKAIRLLEDNPDMTLIYECWY